MAGGHQGGHNVEKHGTLKDTKGATATVIFANVLKSIVCIEPSCSKQKNVWGCQNVRQQNVENCIPWFYWRLQLPQLDN